MARLSSIDRLPDEAKELIGALRRQGRTIDEILAKLRELLPADQQPSRAALGRHTQRLDVIGARILERRAMANALVDRMGEGAENKLTRLNAELLEGILNDMMADEDGEQVTLEPQDAMFLASTLRQIAQTKRIDADHVVKLRDQHRKELEAEMKKKLDAATGGKGFNAAAAEEARRILGFAT
jgi:hypothetical protein